MANYCCSVMRNQAEYECDEHSGLADCPDALILSSEDRYGLRIHDGGTLAVKITFCPWCGTRL